MALIFDQVCRIQEWLDFKGAKSPSFADTNGAGRHGVAGLGIGFMIGFSTCVVLIGSAAGLSASIIQWCIYLILLGIFHAGEWYVTAAYRPKELEYKSWIINHSVMYTAVQLASVLEFWLEFLFLPSLKGNWLLIGVSTIICVFSIGVRIVGMAHCGENFDHIVMEKKKKGHELITDGIYQYLRHPSYFGFYYWSVAAQILLGNPILAVACAIISRKFFVNRIPPEEQVLVKIYGDQYKIFAQRTPIGLPFVQGYVPYKGKFASKQ